MKKIFFAISLILVTGYTLNAQDDSRFEDNFFGVLYLGYGTDNEGGKMIDYGIRELYNFSPYFGWDIYDLKFKVDWNSLLNEETIGLNMQLMTGLRIYTPAFAQNMRFYGAYKLGGGFLFGINNNDVYYGGGFCYDFELGFQIARNFFIAYSFNHQGGNKIYSDPYDKLKQSSGYSIFRLGIMINRGKQLRRIERRKYK